MKEKEFDYEKYVARNKKCAQIIWDNAFGNGLFKLRKTALIVLIEELAQKLQDIDDPERQLDWKDTAFDKKCIIIEALDENFFDKEKEVQE